MYKQRIMDAVAGLDLEATKRLLSLEPSLITVQDRKGLNLLHLACAADVTKLKAPQSAPLRMVNFLLDQGMDIEATVEDPSCAGMPPVWFAVARGRNPAVVNLLIKRGAKPTGLYAAGWYEDLPMLDILVRAGTEIDVVVGVTPFLACWCWKKFEAAKFLARKGANINYRDPQKGKTALHYGIEKEFEPALLKWLVRHGASPDVADNEGITPRLKASRKRDQRYLKAMQ